MVYWNALNHCVRREVMQDQTGPSLRFASADTDSWFKSAVASPGSLPAAQFEPMSNAA